MKKIVPIINLCVTAITVFTAVCGLTFACIAVSHNLFHIIVVPLSIFSVSASLINGAFAFWLRLDKLCRISFYTEIGALVIGIIAIIVTFCA